nr:MAG TPA: hypothetical protein [Caudoviricetes sp.]
MQTYLPSPTTQTGATPCGSWSSCGPENCGFSGWRGNWNWTT